MRAFLRTILAAAAVLAAVFAPSSMRAAETYSILGQLAPGVDTHTVTISNASPAVVTWSGGHPLAANDQVEFTTSGTLPTGLSPNTKYFVLSTGLTGTTFRVSATRGGAAINTSGAGSGTHTAFGYQALYSPSGSNAAVMSSMHVCNRSASTNDAIRIAIVADASPIADKNWISYGTNVPFGDCIYPAATTLQNGGYIYVFSTQGTTSVSVFGAEEN